MLLSRAVVHCAITASSTSESALVQTRQIVERDGRPTGRAPIR